MTKNERKKMKERTKKVWGKERTYDEIEELFFQVQKGINQSPNPKAGNGDAGKLLEELQEVLDHFYED